jgi:hypothetical protein
MKSGDFRYKSIENQNRIRKNFACYDLPIGDILDVVRAIYTMFSIDVFDLDNMLQYPLVDDAFLNARRRTIRTILDMYETHLSSAAEAYDLPMIARTYAEGRKMSGFRYQFTAFNVCLNVYNINDDFVQKCAIVWHYGRVVDVSDIMEYVLIYPVKYSRIAAYGNDGDEIFDALTDKLFEDFIPTMVGLVRKFCGQFYSITDDLCRDIEDSFADAFRESATERRIYNSTSDENGVLWTSCIDSFQKVSVIIKMVINEHFEHGRGYQPDVVSYIDTDEWNAMNWNNKLRAVLNKFRDPYLDVVEYDFNIKLPYTVRQRRFAEIVPLDDNMDGRTDFAIVEDSSSNVSEEESDSSSSSSSSSDGSSNGSEEEDSDSDSNGYE